MSPRGTLGVKILRYMHQTWYCLGVFVREHFSHPTITYFKNIHTFKAPYILFYFFLHQILILSIYSKIYFNISSCDE